MTDNTKTGTTYTPESGHYWFLTHPKGVDPVFPIEEWDARKAEQAKHSALVEPADLPANCAR